VDVLDERELDFSAEELVDFSAGLLLESELFDDPLDELLPESRLSVR